MPRWQRVYLAACAAVIAHALAYAAVDYGKLPHLAYFQLERRLELVRTAPGLPSGYIGLWLWALAAGALAAAATWLATRLRRSPVSTRALGLAAAWAGTALVLAAGWVVWSNWP